MALVLGIHEDFVVYMIVNRFSITKAEIYELFIGDIEGDVFEGDSSDVIQLLSGGNFVVFEDNRRGDDKVFKGDSRFELDLSRIVTASVVVKTYAIFSFDFKDIKK